MSISRRNFLLAGQTLLASAALPMKFLGNATGLGSNSGKKTDLLATTKATFQPLVNSRFSVRTGPFASAWLTLLSVEELKSDASGTMPPGKTAKATTVVDTFMLRFHLSGESLEQGTYELEHPALGEFSLFIVPAGATTYSAIISHVQSVTSIQAPKPAPRKGPVAAPAAN